MIEILSKTKEIEFSTSDISFMGRVKPSAILSYCQDIAVEHAEELGLGRQELEKENLFWVITKFSVRFLSQPIRKKKYFLTTYPLKPQRAETQRDFYFRDEQGNAIINASSWWSVLDIEKHKIKRCNTLFDNFSDSSFTSDIAIKDSPTRITMSDINSYFVKTFQVNHSDLDENFHMNNTKYGNMLLNAFETERLIENAIMGFDLNYVSELRLNDFYTVKRADTGNISYIEASKKASDEEIPCFKARIYWNSIS